MEIIQSFLLSFKLIFSSNPNFDIYYFFGVFAVLWYLWRRREKLPKILLFWVPFAIVGVGLFAVRCMIGLTQISSNSIETLSTALIKLFLCITIMIFVAYNCANWDISKWAGSIALWHVVLTFLAVLMPDSRFWYIQKYEGATVRRMQLLYQSPSALSFVCGMVVLILVYQIAKEGVLWQYLAAIAVMIIDMFYSYSMAGILTTILGVAVIVIAHIGRKVTKKSRLIIPIIAIVSISTVIILVTPGYLYRVSQLLMGRDVGIQYKIFRPVNELMKNLQTTHLLGTGMGSRTEDYANSFIDFASECGVAGVIVVALIIIGLIYASFKRGTLIEKVLAVYAIVMQLTGGDFYDPINYFIYGWILAHTVYNNSQLSNNVSMRLDRKLSIAMIGAGGIIGTTKKILENKGFGESRI